MVAKKHLVFETNGVAKLSVVAKRKLVDQGDVIYPRELWYEICVS